MTQMEVGVEYRGTKESVAGPCGPHGLPTEKLGH